VTSDVTLSPISSQRIPPIRNRSLSKPP